MKGQLWIVAAPSGGGKTSLIAEAVRVLDNVVESISHTTRAARAGEVDGIDYHFVSKQTFDNLVAAKDFLEYAEVFGNCYGTSGQAVDALIESGKDVILNIDWQGALQVKALRPDTKTVFLLPPSLAALRERLLGRGQDNLTVVEKRMAEAREQISHFSAFDYVIMNDDFHRAAGELQSLIMAARLEKNRRLPELLPLIAQFAEEEARYNSQ